MNGPKKHRGISVDIWTDEKFVSLTPLARLLFIGSWHYCCDQGHLDATPLELKMKVLPADGCDAAALVEEIAAAGLFHRGEDGALSVPKLPEHQRLDKRYMVRCERCEDHEGSPSGPRGGHTSTTREDTSGARGDHAGDASGTRAEVEGEVEGEVEEKRGAAKAAKPRQRGTRLPDIFPITDEMREWGRTNAPDIDAPREHEKFCDYWRGVSGQRGVKVDWIATWRNWMRRAQDDAAPRGRAPAGETRPDWMLA